MSFLRKSTDFGHRNFFLIEIQILFINRLFRYISYISNLNFNTWNVSSLRAEINGQALCEQEWGTGGLPGALCDANPPTSGAPCMTQVYMSQRGWKGIFWEHIPIAGYLLAYMSPQIFHMGGNTFPWTFYTSSTLFSMNEITVLSAS